MLFLWSIFLGPNNDFLYSEDIPDPSDIPEEFNNKDQTSDPHEPQSNLHQQGELRIIHVHGLGKGWMGSEKLVNTKGDGIQDPNTWSTWDTI